MNAQQLKNSILQEAIEGRLVPQDPNDEPASVLLDKIRAERKRLVKEKNISLSKPEKACIIKEKGEFSLPQNWKWGMINDVCRVFGRIGFRGYTKNDLRYSHENAAISISPSNMINGTMDFSNCTYISEEKYEESPEIKIQNGDILIVKTGSSYGKTSLVENLPWKSTINPQIAVVKDVTINKQFLIYFFQSPYAQSKFKDFVLGTSIPTFSQLNLISMQIPLPPLAEQKRIVEKIEELLPKVEEYGKAQENLDKLNDELPERLKKSVLQEAIEGRLVPQDPNDEPASVLLEKIRKEKAKLVKEGELKKKDLEETPISEDEIPFEIPESWEWVRLESLVSVVSGTSYQKGDVKKDGIRVLRGGNIQDFQLYLFDDDVFVPDSFKDDNKNIQLGDVVIVGSTGSHKVIGKPAFIKQNYSDCQIGAFLRIIRPLCEVIIPYVHLFFNSDYYRENIRKKVKGTNIYNIKGEYIEQMLFPLPPLAEQKRIVAKIEQLLKEIDKLKTK